MPVELELVTEQVGASVFAQRGWRLVRARATLRLATGLPAVVVILALWQWQATRHPTFFLPSPADIARQLQETWLSGSVGSPLFTPTAWTAIRQTFGTALLGWSVAGAVGVVVGSVIGARRGLAAYAGPPLLLLRSVPPVAVIPIAIVILGLGSPMRITVVVAGCIWPILLNAVAAVSGVEPVLRDVATLSRRSPLATFRRVLLPAASPSLFAGLRVALALAIVLSVGADMFAGAGGLGGLLLGAQNTFDVPGLWAAITVLAVLGAVVNGLLLSVERRALRWNTQGEDT